MSNLATYILVAMLTWSPAREHAADAESATIARYTSVAEDIATVVTDPDEPSVFKGDPTKAETAVLVASVAFFESRFVRYVDDGRCNQRLWRAELSGRKELCDSGQAVSFWQIHTGFGTPHGTEHGIKLVGDGWQHDVTGFQNADLLRDRKVAIRVALHMMRAAMKRGSLCGYTGEAAPCNKARIRLDHATRYFREHPLAAVESPSARLPNPDVRRAIEVFATP